MTAPDHKNANGKWVMRLKSGERTVSGSVWNNINTRCSSKGAYQKNHPSYESCMNLFVDFQSFVDWYTKQIGYGKGWHIDKDILLRGNKNYCPTLCVLLPQELNSIIVKVDSVRGKHPLGVSWRVNRNCFEASCSLGIIRKNLGCFNNADDAFHAYKSVKESFIKQQANKWREQIDPRAYEALVNYQVEITD